MSYGTEDHKHELYDVYGVAGEHHSHFDLEAMIRGLREDLDRALGRIRELEERDNVESALVHRIAVLERQTPAARQAQHEADLAAADLAVAGYDRDRHGPGCDCSYCYVPEPEGSRLAERNAYIDTWGNQDVTRREESQ